MANLDGATATKVIKISLEIPIKAKLNASEHNKLSVDIHVDARRARRFLRKLSRLCRRYGYDAIATDAPSNGGEQ